DEPFGGSGGTEPSVEGPTDRPGGDLAGQLGQLLVLVEPSEYTGENFPHS
ncbi:MAG: hypothetical protein H0X18_13985, partial [Geodermatophilaceae bacterium]|nr:hypothetical protein [Geodermatophilaceae bacterium]